MNNEYKKGFIEAIDGVLGLLKNTVVDEEEDYLSFRLLLKNLENSVLSMKVNFFENYLESKMDDPIVISKEYILDYCKENNLTLKEYKEKIEKLLNESRGTMMTEEEFDRQIIKDKNNKVYALDNECDVECSSKS